MNDTLEPIDNEAEAPEIPMSEEQNLVTVTYLVTGLKPLLCASLANADLSGSQKATGTKEKSSDPAEVAAKLAYPLPNGQYGFPAVAFRTAIITAGKWMKIGKYAAPSVLCAAVMHIGDFVTLIDPKTKKPLKKYSIDSRPGFNKQRGAIMLHRPRFDEWGAMPQFEVDLNLVQDLKLLDRFINIGGLRFGIGAFRIEKKGWFGKFKAERISPN